MSTSDDLVNLFASIGLDTKKAKETVKNETISSNLKEFIASLNLQNGCDKSIGKLLYCLASNYTDKCRPHQNMLLTKIQQKKLDSDAKVLAAIKFLERDEFDEGKFDLECGIGVELSEAEIETAVKNVLEIHREGLLSERYHYNVGSILRDIKNVGSMRWANGQLIKALVDKQIEILLGPKTAADSKKPKAKKAKPVESATRTFEGEVLKFHKPGENPQIRPELMEQHLKETGGMYITRFPPEPNGFLHIGHAKAINFNFSFAASKGGVTNLRYDDTNPEAEEEKYFVAIARNVEWLGFKPHKVTHSSDYFQRLYEIAIKLIKKGKAYVCHMTGDEIKASRGGEERGPRYDSPWRDRPIEESLVEFEKMKRGEYKEGEATLRLKMDMQSPNPCMWDLVAYRVLHVPHHRTKTEWVIYPSYDYTHCLCDSFENITHSLCTTEFGLNREAYYWVCDEAEVYKPVQWEYGRLNISNTVLSKRKLITLVKEGYVNSWDDPRLFTLDAIRRRGFTPKAVNTFVEKLGITTAGSTVDVKLLYSCVRDDLNAIAPRVMAVLDPVPVFIEGAQSRMIDIPDFPHDKNCTQSQSIPFSSKIYIDKSDFRIEDDPNFYRLAPGKSVGLYKAGVIKCTSFETDSEGNVTKVFAVMDSSTTPQTYIQWVAESREHGSPIKAEVRCYSDLFKSNNPLAAEGGYLNDINPDSLKIFGNALVDVRVKDAKVEDKFQFQRIGYFCVDTDSSESNLVFNLTVSLREDSNKD